MDSDRFCKIAPQERPEGRRRLCCARAASEDAVWQSEVRLKVVAGGVPSGHTIRHVRRSPTQALTKSQPSGTL